MGERNALSYAGAVLPTSIDDSPERLVGALLAGVYDDAGGLGGTEPSNDSLALGAWDFEVKHFLVLSSFATLSVDGTPANG